VDLNESIRGIVKQFEPQFSAVGRPPISQELYLDESIARVHADPALLRAALEHLVVHAVQAMPAGGTLTVRTSQNIGVVRLELSDTGQGFTPEERDRLFAPGEGGKNDAAGLGLAIVQSVISDHRGRISVDTAPGAGSTLRIELPVDPQPADDARPSPSLEY
jgi:signal transduction histidine kinase